MKTFFGEKRMGRTTRMLQEAIAAAQAGRAVYVLGSDPLHVGNLMAQAKRISPDAHKLGIKFEVGTRLTNLEWENMRLDRTHPNCVVFADHHAIAAEVTRLEQKITKLMAHHDKY